MRSRLTPVSSLALLLTVPLYSYDLESALAETERQTKAAIASLTDPGSKQAVLLWNTLGTINQSQLKLLEAEQDYRRALALNRALPTPDIPNRTSILNNLATLLQARRDFHGAEPLLKEGYALLKDNNLTHSHSAGPLLSNVALNFQEQGKLPAAERAYTEAETLYDQTLGADTADFALLLSNFGLLNFETGHFAEGISRQRRALQVLAKLSSVTQQRSYVLSNLGLGLQEAGKFAEAKSCFLQAIELERNGPAALTHHLVETLSNLASLEQKLGRYVDARAYQVEAEKIALQNLSPDDVLWATIWNNLGLIAILQHDHREAKRQYEKSAALWLRTLGPTSPQYAGTLANLASLESLAGHHKQSQEIATRVLEIDRGFFGQDHPRIAIDLANLATELFYRHKVAEAISLLLRAETMQEEVHAEDSLAFARTLDDLAVAYQKSKRLAESKHYYDLAIHAYELQQAPLLPQFAACLHQYAGLLRQMQDFANAERVEVRATRADVQGLLAGQSSGRQTATGFR